MSTLEIRNISKTYKKGAVKALDNFNVVLTPGVYGLLGPNGAGKSILSLTILMQTAEMFFMTARI